MNMMTLMRKYTCSLLLVLL